MSTAVPLASMSYAEYLALEARSEERHELVGGLVRAMAGGTPEHAQLSMAIGAALMAALRGGPCRVYSSDLRVRVTATTLTTYPDVTVVCGPVERAADDPNAVTNPAVLVEVLREGSEAYDRGEKFAHYRRLPSLRSYVLVSQRTKRIECFVRDEHGDFVLREAAAGERLLVPPAQLPIEVDDVYAGLQL